MEDTRLRLLASLIGPCPECGNGVLRPVSDSERTNFLCETCGRCWHPELGWVTRVDPTSCPACAWRETCLGARARYGPAVNRPEVTDNPPAVTLRGT